MTKFDFHVYDMTGLVGIFDDYESIVWDMAFFDIGECRVVAPLNDKNLKMLKTSNFIVNLNTAPVGMKTVNVPGRSDEYEACIIVNVRINEDEGFIEAKGKSLEYVLNYRILPQYASCEVGQNIVDKIARLAEIAFPPNPTRPPYNNRSFGDKFKVFSNGAEDTAMNAPVASAMSYDMFFNAVKELVSDKYSYAGFENQRYYTPVFFNAEFRDAWFISMDLCITNFLTWNKDVIFSTELESLYTLEIEDDIEEFSTHAFVAGEGEGSARVTEWAPVEMNEGPQILTRRELFVDARDLKAADYPNGNEYIHVLRARGMSKLVSQVKTYSFEVPTESQYKYKRDFYLGDNVTVRLPRYGVNLSVQVAGATETYDRNGYNCSMKFGSIKETLSQRINKRLR